MGFLAGIFMLGAFALVAVFVAAALVIKVAVRLILLPLFLIKWLLGGVALLILGPILILAGLLVLAVFTAAFALPFLPLFLVIGLVWLLVRATRRPLIA